MKLFKCQNCLNLLYFENVSCEHCGMTSGYLPSLETVSAVAPDGPEWKALADPETRYRFCQNWELGGCNWLLPAATEDVFCRACQHNRTIPNVGDPVQRALWAKVEAAKRRLFYSLIKLRLPLPVPEAGDDEPLQFDFVASSAGRKVMTGHDNGTITIALNEADDAQREQTRTRMDEPYRTLLGHFRHEVGHFYWDRLVRDGDQIEGFRLLFGDERTSYQEALERYHASGPDPNWKAQFVSAYATMHPWEDFAETWAHYLHIVDTLETAYAFGLSVAPRVAAKKGHRAKIDRDAYKIKDMDDLIARWLPLTFAVNSLNRAMGQPDLYPFVLPPVAIEKLAFIHQLAGAMRKGTRSWKSIWGGH